jgi:hypothetical protein
MALKTPFRGGGLMEGYYGTKYGVVGPRSHRGGHDDEL